MAAATTRSATCVMPLAAAIVLVSDSLTVTEAEVARASSRLAGVEGLLMAACMCVLMFFSRYLAHGVGNLRAETFPAPSAEPCAIVILSSRYTATHARHICRERLWTSPLAASLPAKPALRPSLIASHVGPRCPATCHHTLPPRAQGCSSPSSSALHSSQCLSDEGDVGCSPSKERPRRPTQPPTMLTRKASGQAFHH
jgi:hypothetical protein